MVLGSQLKEAEADIMGAGKLSAAPCTLAYALSSLGHVCSIPLSLQTGSLQGLSLITWACCGFVLPWCLEGSDSK